MSAEPVRIAMLGGSLRRESLNARLLRSCVRIGGGLSEVVELAIADLPFYNQDLDRPSFYDEGSRPDAVERFRAALGSANGLVVVSPEYSWSVPGVVKNAIDWVSRPPFDTPITGKPTLLVGGSTGPAGTGRAMAHLRQILQSIRAPVLIDDLQVPFAQTRISDDGTLDDDLETRLTALLEQLVGAAAKAREENLPGRLRISIPAAVRRGEVIPGRSPG